MSKLPGPSRIPTFGTRIPQFGSASKSKNATESSITPSDVGRRVRTADKVGVLRFVGKVQFASEVWCGIELDTDVGKNDGSVEGIRYFSCSRSRGLMTPLSKVSILTERVNGNIAKSRSSEAVSSFYLTKNADSVTSGISMNEASLDVKGERDSSFELGHPLTLKKSPEVIIGDNREKKFDKTENERLKVSSYIYDTNDNQLKINNLSVNNNKVKRNLIRICGEDQHFHSHSNNIAVTKFSSNSTASTSKNNNRNSLLLVETISDKDSSHIETCEELFERNNSCQMFQDLSEKSSKSKETVESTNKDAVSYKPNQTIESKEKTFIKHSSCCADPKELSSDNQSARNFIFNSQDEENKRDSLDLDESLEILSVSQMNDGFSVLDSPFGLDDMLSGQKKSCNSPLAISNFDLILPENTALISDTTINLELTLDTVDQSQNFQFARLEETPSPEELPLDPIPIIEAGPRSETTKSKTNSFITSITSITSLDTGYQGDGEMSRPGSRGADNSPLTRRPLQRPSVRRTDAMTDSDFFTESDADNHDENILRGDRKAQVIDGTLYGVDPQAAADIYVNNRENMDSSGIFTDIESNTRTEELLLDENIAISPSDTSSKTLSENSQNLQGIASKNLINNENKKNDVQNETSKKRTSLGPVISITSNTISPRHILKEDPTTKLRAVKKEIQTEIKSRDKNNAKSDERTPKKPPGRWDAVMNKISKTDSKTNLQEVKSRVFSSVNSRQRASPNSPSDMKKLGSPRQTNGHKSPNNKLRRVRTRVLNSSIPAKNSNGESIHSSLSDLSASPPKKAVGANKKREVHQVTQVLTAPKLSPKLIQPTTVAEGKRRIPPSPTGNKTPKKSIFSSKDKKPISVVKENGRNTVKGGRTSPVIRSPASTRVNNKPPAPKTVEALAVLVQHLIFNVEAFEVPHLRRQVKKFQQETEEIRFAYQRIEGQLSNEKQKNALILEEERLRWREDIAHLIETHCTQITRLTNERKECEEKLIQEQELSRAELRQQYEQKLTTLKREFEKLQKTHEESLDILREENEAIREDIDAKNEEIRCANHESLKLKEDYEAKESLLKEQIHYISKENQKLKQELVGCRQEISKLEDERMRLVEENKRLLSYGEGEGIGVQEIESLRVVLELKQNEVSELRKSLAEATQKAELLAGCQEKASVLQARCEDLQLQLQRKNDFEITLLSEKQKLEQSIQEETNQRRNLSLRNEELQWKLKQNKEVITKILEQTTEDVFNKSDQSCSSFNNDKYSSNTSLNMSFKSFSPLGRSSMSSECAKKLKTTKKSIEEDDSPPASPKVKAVVEKSDSVSYVLDLDESPDVVASRLVRRSFRNSLNTKNIPTKSPSSKRPRTKGVPLSQSSSASSLISPNKVQYNRSRSVSVRNDEHDFEDDLNFSDNSSSPSPYHYSTLKLNESSECRKSDEGDLDYLDDNILDLTLPALPSELGRTQGAQALPMPKHLAGEAMISESNSDDESTSSSSGQL